MCKNAVALNFYFVNIFKIWTSFNFSSLNYTQLLRFKLNALQQNEQRKLVYLCGKSTTIYNKRNNSWS